MNIKAFFIAIFLILHFLPSSANVIYVDSASAGPYHDGSSWFLAYTDIQSAINAASANDSIWVAEGTYYQPASGLSMRPYVGIFGGFTNTDSVFRQRNWEQHVTRLNRGLSAPVAIYNNAIQVASPLTVLDGFCITSGMINRYVKGLTLRNCTFQGSGQPYPGITNDLSFVDIINCRFIDNGWIDVGAGLYNAHSTVRVTGCLFEDNAGQAGGAMYNEVSRVTVTGCRFRNNSAASGGAIYSSFSYYPAFSDNVFEGNTATRSGGALYLASDRADISRCVFTGNRCLGADGGAGSSGGGGAVFASFDPVITTDTAFIMFAHCDFTGNSAPGSDGGAISNRSNPLGKANGIRNCRFRADSALRGGAVYNRSGNPAVINCLFNRNYAQYSGSALYNDSAARLTIINATITGNISGSGGAGLYNMANAGVSVYNTILWGNTDGIQYASPGAAPVVSYCLLQGYGTNAGDHLLDGFTDPWFGDAAAGDFRLAQGSPCINAGTNEPLPADVITDIDGNARIVSGVADLGAYEYAGLPLGISAVAGEQHILSVSPSPARVTASVHTAGLHYPVEAIMADLSGREIRRIVLHGAEELLSLDGMPAGVYLLQVPAAGMVCRWVKE